MKICETDRRINAVRLSYIQGHIGSRAKSRHQAEQAARNRNEQIVANETLNGLGAVNTTGNRTIGGAPVESDPLAKTLNGIAEDG
jgi:hypothetical protein